MRLSDMIILPKLLRDEEHYSIVKAICIAARSTIA